MSDAEQFYAGLICLAILGLAVMTLGAIAMNRNERRDRTQQRHQHTTERDQERAL